MRQARPILSPEQAAAICGRIVPLADEMPRLERRLAERGFQAFVPDQEFAASFLTAEEKQLEQRFTVELVKLDLGQPWPWFFAGWPGAYRSKFLDEQQERMFRKHNVNSHEELDQLYPNEIWKTTPSPLRRNIYRAQVERGREFTSQEEATCRKKRQVFLDEVARDVGEIPDGFADDRVRFYHFVMEREAGPLGFHHDARRSLGGYPLFAKPAGDGWLLAWTIKDMINFLSPDGILEPALMLRSQRFRGGGRERAKPGEALILNWHKVVPSFSRAYWKFSSLAELALIIKAYMFFYSLCAEAIEGAIRSVVAEAGDR